MHHVHLTCKYHPHLRWMCKSIAVSASGTYNGQRNIFFLGRLTTEAEKAAGLGDEAMLETECTCPPTDLTFATDADRQQWQADQQETQR